MKYCTYLALAAAALTAADAQIIPGEYIAVSQNKGACQSLSASIQNSMVDLGVASTPVKTSQIAQTCFSFFKGTDALQAAVAGIQGVNVYPNGVVEAFAPKSWGLDRIDQADLPLDGAAFGGEHSGVGQTVYVLDTGINKDHVDFGGRAEFASESFVDDGFPEDGNGHGSHCAGTATGATYGIATSASVVGVKVLSAGGSGTYAGVIAGMEWAVNHAGDRPSVMSMSLGGPSFPAVDDAARATAEAGHIIVLAAGNNAGDACEKSPAGAGGNGRAYGPITVGSTDISDSMSSYSNFGVCTDIFAPGRGITSAWKGEPDAENTISGTSMACPHVAGVAAVLLEKHNGNRNAAVDELFGTAALDKVTNIGANSPNALLQVHTAVVEPPTSDPTCENGILRQNYCCHSECGSCGGTGCSQRPGGASSCCSRVILEAGKYCDENVAPCLVKA